MDNNNGDENAKKQQQLAIMEEDEDDGMSVPNWLVDVLKWITRMEMANSSLSFSCRMFKQLCWPKLHENVEPHIVPGLEFNQWSKCGNIHGILKNGFDQIIPIASTPPPEYILGFEHILIFFLDTKIIEFVKIIAIKQIDLSFVSSMEKLQEDEEQCTQMRNLLTILAKNIYAMIISNCLDENRFLHFNRQFPTFLDQVPRLFVANIDDFEEFDLQLFNWLMKPLTAAAGGAQKILSYLIFVPNMEQREKELRFINRIKEEFLHSTERKNFLIQFEDYYDEFCLQNEQTGEVLNLYQKKSSTNYLNKFLARYPKGEEHWKEGCEEKISIFRKGNTIIQLEIE